MAVTATSASLGLGKLDPRFEEQLNKERASEQKKLACEAKGGTWNEELQQCIMIPKKPEEKAPATTNPLVPEVFTNQSGKQSGVTLPDGRTFLGLNREDIAQITGEIQKEQTLPSGTLPVGSTSNFLQQKQSSQALQGQIGQFGQLGLDNDPLFDVGQGVSQGLVSFIPKALTALTGLYLLKGGADGAVSSGGRGLRALGTNPIALGTNPRALAAGAGAARGAGLLAGINPYVVVAGLLAGITSSIISEFKAQRRDVVNAQKRVLDDGKQNLNDLATLAAADPANRATYVARYNQQLSLIDQAYRQMLLDTTRDVAKFEQAVPELAEFEAFYSLSGDRDILHAKLRNSLVQPNSPEYELLELAYSKGYI